MECKKLSRSMYVNFLGYVLLLISIIAILSGCSKDEDSRTITRSTKIPPRSVHVPTDNAKTLMPTDIPQVSATANFQQPTTSITKTINATPEIPLPTHPVELTPLPSSVDSSIVPGGTLYVFEQYIYGTLKPSGILQEVSVTVPENRDILPPSWSEDAEFAQIQDRLAYIHNKDGKVDLWVTDLKLSYIYLHWVDEQDLMNLQSSGSSVKVKWGPGDNTVFIENNDSFLIISLIDKKPNLLKGKCKWIGVSPKSGEWALWCPMRNEVRDTYVVVEQDGNHWPTPDLPQNQPHSIIDYAFSPDRNRAVFADENGELSIDSLNGEYKKIEDVFYAEPTRDTFMNVIKWAGGSQRLLIYGQNKEKNLCPVNNTIESPCWVIIDPHEGTILWPGVDQSIPSNSDAELSPDGLWLVMSIYQPPDRSVLLISTQTGQMIKISSWILDGVRWVR